MVEYIISKLHFYTYSFNFDYIGIGANINEFNKLTPNEQIELTSDNLQHEFIHKILMELFDSKISHLFDCVERFFRNEQLHKRSLNIINDITHYDFIKKEGFLEFLRRKKLSFADVEQAYIYSNFRF